MDSHVHGPGISDHTRRKTHWGGYWEMRVQKLGEQHANAAVYGALHVFQDEAQRTARVEREQRSADRKRRRVEQQERRDAAAALPADVPFALAQASPPSQESSFSPTPGAATKDAAVAAAAERRLDDRPPPSRPPRPASASSSAIFSGVVAYINGDTETRHASVPSLNSPSGPLDNDSTSAPTAAPAASSSSAAELSSLHLSNIVRLHGGIVIPYASRRQLTHYVVDHLSFSKARAEMHALVGGAKASANAAARHIHFVKPAWIRACMQAGRRLSEDDFALLHDTQHVSIRERWS